MRKHDMIHKNEEDQKCLFLQKEYFCLRYNREGKQRMYEEFLKQIEDGTLKRILFVPTGALLSTVSFNEGMTVPGIAHAVVIEHADA